MNKSRFLVVGFLSFLFFHSAPSFADIPSFKPVTKDNPKFKTDGIAPQNGDVVIAIIDSGVDYNHDLIKDHLWKNPRENEGSKDTDRNGYKGDIHGWDFKDNDPYPFDHIESMAFDFLDKIKLPKDQYGEVVKQLIMTMAPSKGGHGTHVAGIAQRTSNDELGRGALIMPIRINYSLGGAAFFDQIKLAVKYAVDNGAQIVNMSFGIYLESLDNEGKKSLTELYNTMLSATNTLFVIAAHNYNVDMTLEKKYMEPATLKCPNCITVGATNEKGLLASFTNIGKDIVDVFAPGVNINSAWPDDEGKTTKNLSGTSMSTPYIAGMAGRMLAKCPQSANQLKEQILALSKQKTLMFSKMYEWPEALKENFKGTISEKLFDKPFTLYAYPVEVQTIEDSNWTSFY